METPNLEPRAKIKTPRCSIGDVVIVKDHNGNPIWREFPKVGTLLEINSIEHKRFVSCEFGKDTTPVASDSASSKT